VQKNKKNEDQIAKQNNPPEVNKPQLNKKQFLTALNKELPEGWETMTEDNKLHYLLMSVNKILNVEKDWILVDANTKVSLTLNAILNGIE